MGLLDFIFGGTPDITKLQSSNDIEGLIKALTYNQTAIRAQAAQALGSLRNDRALVALISAMNDPSEEVQSKAAQSIKQYEHEKIAHYLNTIEEKFNYFVAAQLYAELQGFATQELHAAINKRTSCIEDKGGDPFYNMAMRERIEALMFWLYLIQSTAGTISGGLKTPKEDLLLKYALVGWAFMAIGAQEKKFHSTKQQFMALHNKMSDLSPEVKAKADSFLFVTRRGDFPSTIMPEEEIDKRSKASVLSIAQILYESGHESQAASKIGGWLRQHPNDRDFIDLQNSMSKKKLPSQSEPSEKGDIEAVTIKGLMWQLRCDGKERTQADAFTYCRTLQLAGHQDWRLPSLVDFASLGQNLEEAFHDYWTSTPEPRLSPDIAYINDGTTMFKKNKYFVRAVRDVR